jgi:hypothetical protein
MRDIDSNKFITYLAIIATPFALGTFLLSCAPSIQYANENPAADGFVTPHINEHRSIERNKNGYANSLYP